MALGNEANIKAVITADDRASNVVKGFGAQVDHMGASVIAKGILIADAIEAAGKAVIGFGIASVKAFSESEELIAQTNTVLKSTGNIAGVTADQVTKLATALQKSTKYSDEEVRSAENLLLTFTSIGKDVFPDATKVVLDMSTALGQDLKSSSIQLGKALQDPVRGITALRRVGVNFNDQQQDTINHLVETNQLAKAQGMILQELQREFGGSAEAAGNTFGGALAKLKNQFNDVQEIIGQTISQRLGPFVAAAASAVASVDWAAVINRTINVLSSFYGWLQMLTQNVIAVGSAIADYLMPKLTALWNTINTQVLPVLQRLWQEVIVPLIPIVGTALVLAFGAVIDALNLLLTVVTPVINFMLNNKEVVIGFGLAFGALALAMNFSAIVGAFSAQMDAVIAKVVATRGTLAEMVTFLGGPAAAAAWGAFAGGGIAAFVLIQNKAKETMQVLDQLNSHIASLMSADQEAMKDIINKYHSGQISKEQYEHFWKSISQRQSGGPVTSGVPYIVGEKRPELFVPKQDGFIMPSVPSASSSNTSNVNIHIQAGAFMGTDVEARKFAQIVLNHLRDIASAKNMNLNQMLG